MDGIMILIREPKSGQMICLNKPNGWEGDFDRLGYPGWEQLEEREGLPPEHAQWIDGQGWVVDDALAEQVTEAARLNTLSRAELMDEVVNKASDAAVLASRSALAPSK